MRIGIEAQRIFRKNKHGMDNAILQVIKELQKMRVLFHLRIYLQIHRLLWL